MQFRLTQPSADDVRRLIESQRETGAALTYAEVGATADDSPPPGWPARRKRVDLPPGGFDAAKAALADWTQYDLGWTAVPVKPPIVAGRDFATIARTLGLWSVNCCRILYVVDEPSRFGYAIGTLPHHVETGEERFLLTRRGEAISFEISSFSRARHPLVKLGWWYGKRAIRRFLEEGTARLAREVSCEQGTPDLPVASSG